MKKLTALQAYNAMTLYLDNYYNHTLSDDIGSLLGCMQFIGDRTVDLALWDDWIDAVDSNQKELSILEAFIAMKRYLQGYAERISSKEVKGMLENMQLISENETIDPICWKNWMKYWEIIAKNQGDSKSYFKLL